MRIAVFTCDKYNWLIPIFWHFFKKNWQNNPYLIDIVTESKPILFHDRVFYYGNRPWGKMAIDYLKQVEDELLLVILDDYIVKGVNISGIEDGIEECRQPDIGYINISSSEHEEWIVNKEIFGSHSYRIPNNLKYSLCLQACIWKRDFLISLLKENEDSWQTEIEGSKRMACKSEKILLLKEPAIQYTIGGCMQKGEPVNDVWNWIKVNW
jgi:hypothetical protein